MAFVVSSPLDQSAYRHFEEAFPGGPAEAFASLAAATVRRVFEQVGKAAPNDAFLRAFLVRVWEVSATHGFPAPLPDREIGEPGDIPDETLASLSEDVWAELPIHAERDLLTVISYQLFITLLAREFRSCRQSYLETDVDGGCSRQDADFCADRISGSHCEDCPYFVALSQSKHVKLLSRQWHAGEEAFTASQARFLPDDFRLLRQYLHLHRRHAVPPSSHA